MTDRPRTKTRAKALPAPASLSPQVLRQMYHAGACVLGVALAIDLLMFVGAVFELAVSATDPTVHPLTAAGKIAALLLVGYLLLVFSRRIAAAVDEL